MRENKDQNNSEYRHFSRKVYVIVYVIVYVTRSLCHIIFIYFSFSALVSLPLITYVIKTDALVVHFLEYLQLFLDDKVEEESK